MESTILTIPLGLLLWILGILIGVVTAVIGVVYANLKSKVDDVDNDLDDYRKCTDARIESLLINLTKVNERVISKKELTEAINKAVKSQFLEFENRLFSEGRLIPPNP